jgi:hypothetical protein
MKKHVLYILFTQLTYNAILRALKKAGRKQLTRALSKTRSFDLPAFLYKNYYDIHVKFPGSKTDELIYMMEYLWASSERLVVYPRSDDELSILSKSSFKNLDVQSLTASTLIIASPPSSKYPPLLVGYIDKVAIDLFNSHMRDQIPIDTNIIDYHGSIFVVIYNRKKSKEYLSFEISSDDMPKYALAKSNKEILSYIKKVKIQQGIVAPTDEDYKEQSRVIKYAMNMWLYRVTNPDHFIKQTPPTYASNYYGSTPTNSITLDFSKRIRGSQHGSVAEVGIHMRCLRHERYYNSADWKDKPRGSRWVEISPYTRGAKGIMVDDED